MKVYVTWTDPEVVITDTDGKNIGEDLSDETIEHIVKAGMTEAVTLEFDTETNEVALVGDKPVEEGGV